MQLLKALRGLDSRVVPGGAVRKEAGTFTAAGKSLACWHCGGEQFQQRYWWTAGTGMALLQRSAGLVKQGRRSVRFLACAECGLVMTFIPDAARPPDVDPPSGASARGDAPGG